MRVVAMVSGGKDSCYNMMQCVAEGHDIVALANLHPKDIDELDSYMYQTVGHMGIEILAKAMKLPLYRKETKGKSTQIGKFYTPTDEDEVEDLYELLQTVKNEFKIEAVAVGAILSDYQRVRVENVCNRLNLIPLAYLWRRDQTELLQEMIDCHVDAIIIKVATLGLIPEHHLGKSIKEMQPHLYKMKDKFGLNVCGEGGEYETFTLDCPLFKEKINIEDMQIIISSADPVCPVGYINFTKLSLAPKEIVDFGETLVKKSLDYINDINESSYSDLSDPDLSESELELIEKETRLRSPAFQSDILPRSNSFGRQKSCSKLTTVSLLPILSKSSSADEQTYQSAQNVNEEIGNTSKINLINDILIQRTPLSPMKYECEHRPLHNESMAAINSKGWTWLAGIQGCGESLEDGVRSAMKQLQERANEYDFKLSDYCYITMYVRNILDYSIVNEIYAETFNFPNPPTRVCIESPLSNNCHVILEAVAFKGVEETNVTENSVKRHTMHVQGISHWAPANIGPYSQSTKVGEITYISGQIALVPGSMTIVEGGIRPQCKLALRHITRIAKAMNSKGQLRDVVQGICFLTHPSYITEARRQWERRSANAIMDYIVVPGLPKKALVEWQVWAHAHNDRFEYEETGRSVGDYTISIRRRWNYENNCAAIVCYVSTVSSTTVLNQPTDQVFSNHCRLAQNLTADNINEILIYVLGKLLKNHSRKSSSNLEQIETNNMKFSTDQFQQFYSENENNKPSVVPAIHLKVFYEVQSTPSVELLLETLKIFKMKIKETAAIVYTVIPACNLHNFSTFLSICGIRHE